MEKRGIPVLLGLLLVLGCQPVPKGDPLAQAVYAKRAFRSKWKNEVAARHVEANAETPELEALYLLCHGEALAKQGKTKAIRLERLESLGGAVLPISAELMAHDNPLVVHMAALVISNAGDPEKAIPIFLRHLYSSDPKTRVLSAAALEELGRKAEVVVPHLALLLFAPDSDANFQRFLAGAIDKIMALGFTASDGMTTPTAINEVKAWCLKKYGDRLRELAADKQETPAPPPQQPQIPKPPEEPEKPSPDSQKQE